MGLSVPRLDAASAVFDVPPRVFVPQRYEFASKKLRTQKGETLLCSKKATTISRSGFARFGLRSSSRSQHKQDGKRTGSPMRSHRTRRRPVDGAESAPFFNRCSASAR